MTTYTLHWECPYCDESNTQLDVYAGDPPDPTANHNRALAGLKQHVRRHSNGPHGPRHEFPDDWSLDLAREHIEITPLSERGTDPEANLRKTF